MKDTRRVFVSGLRCRCRCCSRCHCRCMPHVATVASLDAAVNQICASLSFGVQVQIVQRKESQRDIPPYTAYLGERRDGSRPGQTGRTAFFFFLLKLLVVSDFICTNNFLLGVSSSDHATLHTRGAAQRGCGCCSRISPCSSSFLSYSYAKRDNSDWQLVYRVIVAQFRNGLLTDDRVTVRD